jgi:hypothetical protein
MMYYYYPNLLAIDARVENPGGKGQCFLSKISMGTLFWVLYLLHF